MQHGHGGYYHQGRGEWQRNYVRLKLTLQLQVLDDDEGNTKSPKELTPGRKRLNSWLNRSFKVVMSDGRIIVGTFMCTDKDANIILAMCSEYMEEGGESRNNLGLVMIPGRHIVSIKVDMASEPPPFMNYNRSENCESDE